MNAFWVLTRLRMLEVLRSAPSAGFLFGLPLALLLIVGGVFLNGHPFERRHVVIDASTVSLSEQRALRTRLAGSEELRLELAANLASAQGKLRSRMASAVLAREPNLPALRLLVGPRDVLFGRGLLSVLREAKQVELEVVSVPRFGYVHFLFPGVLTFSILTSGLFGMGYAMVRYRQSLFLKKLATTPLSRTSFVASQIVSRALLVLVQVALLSAGARLLFDLPLNLAGALWLTAVSILGLLTFMGAGFALSCWIRSESAMVDVISTINLPLVFLSELFFLLDELPRPLALAGELLPTTHMVRLLREVLLYGTEDVARLGPGLAALAGWTAATFLLSLKLFRWHA